MPLKRLSVAGNDIGSIPIPGISHSTNFQKNIRKTEKGPSGLFFVLSQSSHEVSEETVKLQRGHCKGEGEMAPNVSKVYPRLAHVQVCICIHPKTEKRPNIYQHFISVHYYTPFFLFVLLQNRVDMIYRNTEAL